MTSAQQLIDLIESNVCLDTHSTNNLIVELGGDPSKVVNRPLALHALYLAALYIRNQETQNAQAQITVDPNAGLGPVADSTGNGRPAAGS